VRPRGGFTLALASIFGMTSTMSIARFRTAALARHGSLVAGLGASLVSLVSLVGCKRGEEPTGAEIAASASAVPAAIADAAPPLPGEPTDHGVNSMGEAMPTDRPMLGITSFVGIVYAEPRDTSKRLGYLRVGAKVPRSAEPAGTKGCKEGWYEIWPRGFVCVGKDATLDLEHPVLRAASRPPDLSGALPYRYGFVRAVLPLYLRVPTKAEQLKSEFKLEDHLAWYEENRATVDRVGLGAFDVPLDRRGVPIAGKQLGELGQQKNSLEVGLGVLFGGQSDDDPPPWWLEGGKRAIPNISGFDVPEYAVFADRARRFTGLALVGSFAAGEDAYSRRFAITTDLRLAPTTKLKPDTGSPWHGFEIHDPAELPMAFVREQGATSFRLGEGKASPGEDLEHRARLPLTGKQKRVGGERYYALREGGWVRASDVGLVVAPSRFPKAADDGEKWIEVSISQQTLVLWEGKRPVYATLVSTGRKEYPTVTGTYRIYNKHITATMDSNEASDVGGGSTRTASASDAGSARESKSSGSSGAVPRKGDGEYGVTKRRGEGTYQLRDVPYIQYFEKGFALHVAYWHDKFGQRRSHGCINLSPIDGHRIFHWTEPAVPEGWHAINMGDGFGQGTVIVVHD